MPKTWKGMKRGRKRPIWKVKVERYINRRMAKPLLRAMKDCDKERTTIEEYEKIRDKLPLSIRDIMKGIGLDYYNRLDYSKVQGYFADNRKLLADAMTFFVQPDEDGKSAYDRYLEKGMDPKEIFRRFIVSAMSYGIYPFYADRNDGNKLKPLERADYNRLLNQRLDAIKSEVNFRHEEVKQLDPQFAISKGIKRPELKDGTLFKLPPAEEEASD